MARKSKAEPFEEYEITNNAQQAIDRNTKARVNLGELLSQKDEVLVEFSSWLVGTTPLICHAWSFKAKQEMLKKQTRATQLAKEERNPDQDFRDSLYDMGNGRYGFPVTAVKAAILSNAHVKRGVAKTDVQAALWLDAEQVSTRPALAGARCDMPLVQIWGSEPEMREDMVRIGAGLRKIANLAYRAQFTVWAINVRGFLNTDLVPPHALAFLLKQAGTATGIGDWRNEKKGWFGAFRFALPDEAKKWDDFAAGKGPLPAMAPMKKSTSKAA